MTRIALITSRFPFGAKEAFLREEIVELSRAFEVIVVPALPTGEAAIAASIRAERLRLLSWPVLAAAWAECRHAPAKALRALLDVVAAPASIGGKCKNLCIFPTGLAAARCIRELGVQHVHAYWLAIPATVAYIAATMNDLSWSATGHRYDLVDSNMSAHDVGRTFIATARFIRTISKSGEERVRSALGEHADSLLLTEHLGVRLPVVKAPVGVGSSLRLICAANLEYVKGHVTLLQALATATAGGARVTCTLAGDGTLRTELESLARSLNIDDRVTFAGHVPHELLLRAIEGGGYDAAILTSVDEGPQEREGIPIFLAECMAAGLPVIATRSGAVEELVDSTNGILCETGDDRAIATAIVALTRDTALRSRLGAAGRETIAARFDVRKNAPRIVALLAESAA